MPLLGPERYGCLEDVRWRAMWGITFEIKSVEWVYWQMLKVR